MGPPAQVFVAERNPYFHRVDERGRQLPYIDRLVMILVERAVISVKTSTGESDLQARYLSFDQVPFLRKNERLAGYRVFLWNTGVPSTVAIYPNLTTTEPVMRKLLLDRRFRQALSLGINREEINQILYYGLGLPGQNTVLRNPAGHEEPRMAYARFDLRQANRLLDAMGLTARDGRGFRLRPDGRRLDLIVETSGDESEHTDVLELVKDTWAGPGHRAPHPPEPARGVPPPGLLGGGDDERLQRELRVRAPHAGHEPGLARAGQPAAAPVAPVG